MFDKKKSATQKASKIEVLTSKELNAIQGGFEYKNIEVVKGPVLEAPDPGDVTLQQIKP